MKKEPFSKLPADLRPLVDAYCAGTLTPQELARLETLLRGDSRAQLFLAAYMEVHAGLHWGLRGGPAAPAETLPVPLRQPSDASTAGRLRLGRPVLAAASLTVVLLACAVLVWIVTAPPKIPYAREEAIARVAKVMDAQWTGREGAIVSGTELLPGEIALVTGMAELEFHDGGILVLEAPVRLELTDAANCTLTSGRCVLRTAETNRKLTVHTPTARLMHLGTEFGMAVESDGTTLVQVYEGAVLTTLAMRDADTGQQHTLHAGESLVVDATATPSLRSVPFVAERFMREFPPLLGQGVAPCNRPNVNLVRVLPAPREVKIDGDLADWNLAGQFRSLCEPPFDQKYSLEGAMMYDAKRLYLGAHVRDPAAMRNVLEPENDAEVAWRGGSVQVRLSCDRRLSWPVQARNYCLRERENPRPPADINEKLVHLTLWWSTRQARPCLHVDYGMDFNRGRTNPSGFRAAFHRDDDGHGYTLEYAIPWDVLNATDDPPQGGDVLAACWTLHWSDEGGRVWRGHLIDVVNPDTTDLLFKDDLHGLPFLRAELWGKAVYEPTKGR